MKSWKHAFLNGTKYACYNTAPCLLLTKVAFQAKADLQLLYGSLSQPEKDNLTKGIKKGKGDGSNVIVLDFADGHSNENSSTVDKPVREKRFNEH